MSIGIFDTYQSQSTRQLAQIQSSKYPDTNKDFEANLRRLNQFVDYIASYIGVMQKGIDQANQDSIQRIKSTISDFVVLLGGGELLYGIDLGDLQYFLPALGALFGFDMSKPFPINLLEAAEHFFLGYVVPLDAFVIEIEDIIDGWMTAAGLPSDFITSIHDLLDAITSVTSDFGALYTDLWGVLDTLGINTDGLGPFADLWHAVTQLLSGKSISQLHTIIDPIFHSLAPWIEDLALIIDDVDAVINAFSAGTANLNGILNLGSMVTNVTNLLPAGTFDPIAAWLTLFQNALTPAGVPGLDATKIISGTFAAPFVQPLIDAISVGFGGSTGNNFTSLQSFITSIPSAQATIDKMVNTLTGDSATGHSLTDLAVALIAYPANYIAGVLATGNIPGLDASKVVSGQFLQSLIPGLTSGWGKTIDAGLIAGAVASAASVAVSGITGLATGVGTWLSGGGALPSATTAVASQIISGVFGNGLIPGLDFTKIVSGQLPTARATWVAPIDTLMQAWGAPSSGYTPTDLLNWASAIPFPNLQGTLGAPNLGQALEDYVTGIAQTLQNDNTLANQTIAQVQNYFGSALAFLGWNPAGATPAGSVAAIASGTQTTLNNRAVQASPQQNVDRTMNATFDASDIFMGTGALPTIAVTQGNPVSGMINCRDGGQKQSIRWKGYTSSGTLTGFYINLYRVDPSTGVWTWFYSTPNYVASLATGTSPQHNSFNIPALSYINTTAGDEIQAEISVVGGGTYTMVGKTINPNWLPMPGVIPPMPGGAAMRQQYSTAPTLDAVSTTPWRFTGIPTASGSTTINVGSRATVGYVILTWAENNGAISSVTWGGHVMSKQVMNSQWYVQGGTIGFMITVYEITAASLGLQYLPSGNTTVSAVLTNAAGHQVYVNGTAISVNSCLGSGTVQGVVSGTSTSANQTVTDPGPNQLVLQVGQVLGNPVSLTVNGSPATAFWSDPGQAGVAYGGWADIAGLGGSGNLTTAMALSSSAQWGVAAIPLLGMFQPAPATVANPSNPGVTSGVAQYTRSLPWIGLSGVAGTTSYSPITKTFAAGSGQTFNPSTWVPWADFVDVIQWPSGGSGAGGASGGGNGGSGSTPTVTTLTKAQVGASAWTINVPAGPGSTPPNTNGTAGSSASTVVPGYGTLNAANVGAAGAGAGSNPSGQPGGGAAAANYTDGNGDSVLFGGGGGGGSPQAGGGAPGGGGAGGNSTFFGSYTYGGGGGDGQTILRAYQKR